MRQTTSIQRPTRSNEDALQHRDDQDSAGRLPSSLISILPRLRKEPGAPRGTRTGRRLPIEGSGEGRVSGAWRPTCIVSISAAFRSTRMVRSRMITTRATRRWRVLEGGCVVGRRPAIKATTESALGRPRERHRIIKAQPRRVAPPRKSSTSPTPLPLYHHIHNTHFLYAATAPRSQSRCTQLTLHHSTSHTSTNRKYGSQGRRKS